MRPLTAREQAQRLSALACTLPSVKKPHDCSFHIHVGIFFDGTNNNKKRDQEDIPDPLKRSHTNVVVLHDACKDDKANGFFKIYIPGVGTPFPEIGEFGELPEGKSMGEGGDARINWALIQLLNAMHRALYTKELFSENEARQLATTLPLHRRGVAHANTEGKVHAFIGAPSKAFSPRLAYCLALALKNRPVMKLRQVSVSVFGFSRGAAAARAFCHFLDKIMEAEARADWRQELGLPAGGGRLAGVPLRVQFLGLFDTVCSVGLADSSPGFRGFGGWANGTQDIAPIVERSVHFVAAHELRQNFPLSSSRKRASYPANALEVVYPGAHSDVGGGYPCNSQGKAKGARSKLLSQVPLVNMYMEARISGVPLMNADELREERQTETIKDLQVDSETARLFAAYARAVPVPKGGTVEQHCAVHIQWMWRWLEICSNLEPYALQKRSQSYRDAPLQDRIDMEESLNDYRKERRNTISRNQLIDRMPKIDRMLKIDYVRQYKAGTVQQGLPKDVERFFDTLVHDSHATFYMVGPITEADQRKLIEQVRAKQRRVQEQERYRKAQGHLLDEGYIFMNEKLSKFDERVLAYQHKHPGKLPLFSDLDIEALKSYNSAFVNAALWMVDINTRRESGGHIRYREVYDRS